MHRTPLIVVIENPAGRVALVDMMEVKSDTSRCNECINQPSRDNRRNRLPGLQVAPSTMMLKMFSRKRIEVSKVKRRWKTTA